MADPNSTVAPGFEGYIGDMLSTAWGLSKMPYQPYTGERFAPTSPLQERAFGQYQGLGQYQPGQFNTGLGPVGSVQDYMNPFMQNVVDIQAREARRQADISRQAEQGRLTQAGAYGGSRQAIMEAERQRNLGEQIGDIQSKGLMAAYEQAQKQRLGEATLGLEGQRLGEASRQFGAQQGLRTLADQMAAGTVQRGIAQEPLTFGYEQFKESVAAPKEAPAFMASLLGGLPTRANVYQSGQPGASIIGSLMQGGLGGAALYKLLSGG